MSDKAADNAVDRAAAMKAKLLQAREQGVKVVVHKDDGTDKVRYLKPRDDGPMQWTDEAGKPIDPHGETDAA